jgi:dUTP pyrophosphatase
MYEQIKISTGDRIAQIIFKKHEEVEFVESEKLSETERSSGGYGSSGN